MAAYRELKENEMMDLDRYLRMEWGRTFTEIRQDKRVIDFLMKELNSDSRELSRYRIKKQAERVMRMATDAGNMKMMLEGSKMLFKAEGFDRPDEEFDATQGVNELPPIFTTDPSKINSNLRKYKEEDIERIRRKYGVEKDKTMEMVEAKKGLFVESGTEIEDNDPLIEDEYDSPDIYDENEHNDENNETEN